MNRDGSYRFKECYVTNAAGRKILVPEGVWQVLGVDEKFLSVSIRADGQSIDVALEEFNRLLQSGDAEKV